MIGQVGEAEKQSKARQEISKIDAQTAVLETQRKSEKAEAEAQWVLPNAPDARVPKTDPCA